MTDEQYIPLVDHFLNTVNSFASNGSGWITNKIVFKVVRFSPITASSYLKLPPTLDRKVSQNLINIRNTNDNNCFGYCFTAAYHLYYGPSLSSEQTAWRERHSVATYREPEAYKAKGHFDQPMSLHDIPCFEEDNDVSVIVFK